MGTRNYVFISAGGATYCHFEAERLNKNIENLSGKDEIIATETHGIIINLTGTCQTRKN